MKALSKITLTLYLLALLWLILFKFSLDISLASQYESGVNLIPFANASRGNWGEMIANLIVFVPFGLLLGVNLKRATFGGKLALIFVLSLIAEVIQLVFSLGTADMTDVITNTSGGLLGLLLYSWGSRLASSRKLDQYVVAAVILLLVSVSVTLFSGRVKFQSSPGSKAAVSQTTLLTDAQLAWPTSGQAAVGTTADGVLAKSSKREKQLPTASMAKVITALAILEKQPLALRQAGPTYTLTAQDVANYEAEAARGGSVVAVHEGLAVTQYQALQMILVASSNNMANSLVEKVFGSEEAYVAYAQKMLQRNGFKQTVVADASGFDPSTVSTPSELVAIGIEALNNPVIAQIVAQQQAEIPGVGVIKNTNNLLGTNGVIGLKTGTTDEAGSCLLFAAESTTKTGKKVTIVGVIMGDTDTAIFSDSQKLLDSVKQGLGTPDADPVDDHVSAPTMQPSRRQDRMLDQ